MQTTIKNDCRVYYIVSSTGKTFFCNIEDLNKIVNENNLIEGYFNIYWFWNHKQKKITKKDLKAFFEGAQLKQEFYY